MPLRAGSQHEVLTIEHCTVALYADRACDVSSCLWRVRA